MGNGGSGCLIPCDPCGGRGGRPEASPVARRPGGHLAAVQAALRNRKHRREERAARRREVRARDLGGLDAIAASAATAALLPPRPRDADGTFLRILTVNDVYKLDNYPMLASAVTAARASSSKLDCVVTSNLNGDFVSPCLFTALDGGVTMIDALDVAKIDYVCLGNHEFDMGAARIGDQIGRFGGKTVNSNTDVPELKELPRFETIQVGNRVAVLAGCVTDDRDIYSPANYPNVTPVEKACVKVWRDASEALGRVPDLFVPMTHQLVEADRQTAKFLRETHASIGPRMPVILGGHEHEVIIEDVSGALLVKVGEDAQNIGVVDIWWSRDGALHSSCSLLPAAKFPPEPSASAFVREKALFLEDMMGVPLATLPEACSSKNVRYEPSGLATFLLNIIKRSLERDKVEVVLLNGGGVRGGSDYAAGAPFTLGDLYKEISFPTEQALIELPGSVLAEAISYSRSAAGEKPQFLHADDGVEVSSDHRLLKINGKPLEPTRLYRVSIIRAILAGMNRIEPLLRHVQESKLRIPSEDTCFPAKELIVKTCMKDAWRCLVNSDVKSYSANSRLSEQELRARVLNLIASLDTDADGMVSEAELSTFLKKRNKLGLLQHLMKTLDADQDGRISLEEFMDLAW
eukprot:TRINITY_DN30149_c0_g1_i3.p1 TRINITY_DN30149_c0_g1~~TRINITY_DN30149_c0_g1_i3.p1  ORF type:complete len:634 (-),score=149.17 TRINITY_DN30149_c0_g1_i3:84-1985(-)